MSVDNGFRDLVDMLDRLGRRVDDHDRQIERSNASSVPLMSADNAFATGTATGHTTLRTDLNQHYVQNSAGQQVGPRQRFTLNQNGNLVAPYTVLSYPFRGPVTQKILVVAWGLEITTAAPNNGTSYWTINVFANTLGTNVFSFATNALGVGDSYPSGTCTYPITSSDKLVMSVTPTGAPGGLYVTAELWFQEIQT